MLLPDVPTPEAVFADLGASAWLKEVLSTALLRDPIDAADDAMVLANVLDHRSATLLNSSHHPWNGQAR